MVPPVLNGEILHFTVLPFLPQVAIAFRVDALSLLNGIGRQVTTLWPSREAPRAPAGHRVGAGNVGLCRNGDIEER